MLPGDGKLSLLAIGGGGFTWGTHQDLDLVVADICGQDGHLGFIGSASGDDPARLAAFYGFFDGRIGSASHMPRSATSRDLASWLDAVDMIYVGGGDTAAMLRFWKDSRWDQELKSAARNGLRLSGVSAGAICWFEEFIWKDREENTFQPVEGLGLLGGSACPHYNMEADRSAAFRDMIHAGDIRPGYGIGEGSAIQFTNGRIAAVFNSVTNSASYGIDIGTDGALVEIPVVTGQVVADPEY